jgi:hypothetical protein
MATANWKPMIVLIIGCYSCSNEPSTNISATKQDKQPEKKQVQIIKPAKQQITIAKSKSQPKRKPEPIVIAASNIKEQQGIKETGCEIEMAADQLELSAGWNSPIVERNILANTKSTELFNKLLPSIEKISVYNNKDVSFEGSKGTKIFIPAASFVDANGQPVNGKVDIELLEIASVGDFLKANLQTICNGQVLQSEGMFFMDAKAGGQSLQLASGKQLQIKQPIMGKKAMTADLRIFSGNRDSTGNINWTENNTLSKKLIPLPLHIFDFTYWKHYDHNRKSRQVNCFFSDSKDTQTFKQKNLANTFIATKEFQKRFFAIVAAEYNIGYYTSVRQHNKTWGAFMVDTTISSIYLNNLDKELWYCDSLAYAYLKNCVEKQGIELRNGHFSLNRNEGYDTSSTLLNVFKNFYEERFTTVTKIPTDVELWKYDAREQLATKGYKQNEIDEIMDAYQQQKIIMNAISDRKAAELLSYNSFAIAKLGWINCDRFYNEPNARPATILASVNNKDSFPFTTTALVLNGRRVLLNGVLNDKDNFSFTGSTGNYTKLPIGEKATIVAMSYKNGKPYIGIKELVLEEKASYKLNMEETSFAAINQKLAGLY